MKLNYHKEAIKVLRDVHTEHEMREFLMKIAEVRPSAILRAAGISVKAIGWSNGATDERTEKLDWTEMDALIIDYKQIAAIKKLRSITGMGLKEAKDACDARRSHLIAKKRMVADDRGKF